MRLFVLSTTVAPAPCLCGAGGGVTFDHAAMDAMFPGGPGIPVDPGMQLIGRNAGQRISPSGNMASGHSGTAGHGSQGVCMSSKSLLHMKAH